MKFKWVLLKALFVIVLLTGCGVSEKFAVKINKQSEKEDTEEQVNVGEAEENEDKSGDASSPAIPKDYETSQGTEIKIPYGALAFSNRVVEFVAGDPTPIEKLLDPEKATGEPDFIGTTVATYDGFVSLGGGGHIILEFENVYLVDGAGDDLYIFEIGPAAEAMEVEISKDGTDWIRIGEVAGGVTSVDIGPYVSIDDKFSFVKLLDLKSDTRGDSPGADIDAIAAINAILK